MRRIILGAVLAGVSTLGGCVGLNGTTPPGCEGGSRRPLNRSMWDWDGARGSSSAPGPAGEAPASSDERRDPAPGTPGAPVTRQGRAGSAPVVAGPVRLTSASVGAASYACPGEASHG